MGQRLPITGKRHEYVYIATTLFADIPVADLPLRNVTFSWARNKPGTFSADLQVPVFSRVSDYLSATVPGRAVIYVFRDGVPIWGGIIWKRVLSSENRTIKLEGDTFDSYMYHRVLDQDLQFLRVPEENPPIPGTDQIEMFRVLWAHMSGRWDDMGGLLKDQPTPPRPNADIGVTLDSYPNHTILRGRHFKKWDFRTYGEHLETLSKLRDGFDWCALVTETPMGAPSASGVSRRIAFGYPKFGRPFAQTGFIWEYPANMLTYTWTGDSDKAATAAFVLGSGEGDLRAYTVQYNTERLREGWPLLDVTYTHSTVVRQETLISHAAKYLRAYDPPVATFDMTIHPDLPPTFGPPDGEHYFIGDEVGLKIDDEIFNEAGIRPEDMFVVINGISVTPNDDGLEVIKPEIELKSRNPYIGPDEEQESDKVPPGWEPTPPVDIGSIGFSVYSTTLGRSINLREGTGGWGGSRP